MKKARVRRTSRYEEDQTIADANVTKLFSYPPYGPPYPMILTTMILSPLIFRVFGVFRSSKSGQKASFQKVPRSGTFKLVFMSVN